MVLNATKTIEGLQKEFKVEKKGNLSEYIPGMQNDIFSLNWENNKPPKKICVWIREG